MPTFLEELSQDQEYSQHQWLPQGNPDGSPWNGNKQARAQTSVTEPFMKCFAQMQKEKRAMQKLLAHVTKKGKRKSHKCSSHENSASDDSDRQNV